MKSFNFLVFILLLVYSCTSKKKADLTNEKFCTELYTDSGQAELNDMNGFNTERTKAVALHSSLWWHDIGFPIYLTVIFLNGDTFQINKVRRYAKEWEVASAKGWNDRKPKIRLRFLPYDGTGGNDIRISFKPGGSASYVGSDAKRVPLSEPTMFLGWINNRESEESIRAVILHEFGHAMGLVHEHQHPGSNILWDSLKVYKYYHDTQTPPWDEAKVNDNIFKKYSYETTNYTAYDIHSIMHYSFPSSLTKDGSSAPWNTLLSESDKSFIKTIYRYEQCVYNDNCCFDRRGRRVLCP